ncbi:hypothetical protein DICPUDRAFT_13673, partial [Dictyostelium purpureum]
TVAARYSGLQKEVLSLYRKFIRASQNKDKINNVSPNNSSQSITNYIRNQFRLKAGQVSRREINKIELLLLKGRRQLEQVQDPHYSGFQLSSFSPKLK